MTETKQHAKKKESLFHWLSKRPKGIGAFSLLALMLLAAAVAPYIASGHEGSSMPPLIPFSPANIDTAAGTYQAPFTRGQAMHWLGTDYIGRDVAAIMLHGTRSSLFIALTAAILATIIGVFAGATAGFLGNKGLRISLPKAILYFLATGSAGFWGIYVRRFKLLDALTHEGSFMVELAITLIIIAGIWLITYSLSHLIKLKPGYKQLFIPVDALVLTWIDFTLSIPVMILVVCLLAIIQPSPYLVVVIIGLTTWPSTARLLRAEVLNVKQSYFVQHARTAGMSERLILWRYILPNALTPVYAAFAFSASDALLIESGLSFLHIGTAADSPSWGSLIAQVVTYPAAWHLAVFPGATLFCIITALNVIGELLQQYYHPKQRISS